MRLSRDPVKQRRLAALALLLCIAAIVSFGLGIAAGAGSGGDDEGDDGTPNAATQPARDTGAASALPLRQRVGQTLVLSFAGTTLPSYVRDILSEGRAAGVILFGQNAVSPGQLRTLTKSIQRAARGSALVSLDQEGGDVRIMRWAAPDSAAPQQATPAKATSAARATARDLRAAGVNVNLAPVADIPAAAGSFVTSRAFPGDPAQVSRLVRAALSGYRREGVAATVKHFPGLGGANANTDDAPATVKRTRSQIEGEDLAPYRAAVASDAPLVMTGHALYPAYDKARIASQSPALLQGLLRERLGFRGAIITDSSEADAVLARSSVEVAAERSLVAGADLVLMTGPGSYPTVYRRLLARAQRSPEFQRRVTDAAARVLALKRRLGLRPPPEPS